MLLDPHCTGSITSGRHPLSLVSGNRFIGRFSLKLSLIKPSKVMYMVKNWPTVLNFNYDFTTSTFFWDTLQFIMISLSLFKILNQNLGIWSSRISLSVFKISNQTLGKFLACLPPRFHFRSSIFSQHSASFVCLQYF